MTIGPMPGDKAADYLVCKYAKDRDHATRAIEIAAELGLDCEPWAHGIIQITRVSPGKFEIEEQRRKATPGNPVNSSSRTIAPVRPSQYSSRKTTPAPPIRRPVMPASRRAAAPVVEEPAAEARDYTEYRDKEPTPTMSDFADWIVQEVGIEYPTAKELAAFRNGVRLGGTLRMEFQASDMNKERRAARRAAREAQASANGQAAEPEVAATPPARGRGRGKTAATAAATPAPPKATAGKARGRRGAPVAAATGADAEAPY